MARKRILPTKEELAQLTFNPFINEGFVIKTRKRITPNVLVKDKEGHFVPMEFEHEVEQPTKYYANSDIRLRVGMLNNGAKALFLWLMAEIDSGKDYVVINRQRFMAENLYKTDTALKDGLLDLSRYQFITPTVLTDVYWINPRMFFRGSRVNKYPANVQPVTKTDKSEAGEPT